MSVCRQIYLCLLLAWSAIVPIYGASEVTADLPAETTEVRVGVYVIDLIEIDGASQTFRADIAVRIRWQDPRLAKAGAGKRRLPLDEVWHPRMVVTNLRQSDRRLPEDVVIDEDGLVTYRQRVIGIYSAPLDLRDFPHDEQVLKVQVVGSGYTHEQVRFVRDDDACGQSDRFSLTDWKIGDFQVTAAPYAIPGSEAVVPGLALSFDVERITNYYVGTIFATVAIIGMMAWLVYWLPVNAINPRVSVSVTSMLALIAYRFVAAKDLPRLPYLTRMDHFLLAAAVLILLGLAMVVTVAHYESKGKLEQAVRLNLTFRWFYPVALAGLMVFIANG